MQKLNFENISLDKINLSLFSEKGIEVSVLRLDKIHPVISGNKSFKLKFYFDEAKQLNKKTIVTLGGAWSNHIVASAAAANMFGLNSVGIIRGEEAENLSETLLSAKEYGMKLHFVSREDYRSKIILNEFKSDENYFIPEGGYGKQGAEGAESILQYCKKENFTHYICATGTGTMLAGIINASLPDQSCIGISVLKNNFDLENSVQSLLKEPEKDFSILHDYHFGGYAKYNNELIASMNEFYKQSNIPSDFVYTGKLFFAVNDLARKNFFLPGNKLLIIHSGGLQGNASLSNGTLLF